MKSKRMLILVVLLSPCVAQESRTEPAVLRLHLPRTAVTEKDRLTLGDVAVLHSEDGALSTKASAVPLGRAPWPAEKLAMTRTTILSRLASHGISGPTIRFSGAAKVTVERKTKRVSAEQIARLAAEFVKNSRRGQEDGSVLEPTGTVREMVFAKTAKVALKVRQARTSPPGHVAVEVVAQCGEKQLASSRVLYKRVYFHKVTVAVKEIKPGEAISPANTKTERVKAARPQGAWQSPYGLVAPQRYTAGSRIDAARLTEAAAAAAAKASPVRVKRNDKVIIRVRGPGFVILASGVALEDGKVGDAIRVRCPDTQREIEGTIAPDGAVESIVR